MVIASDLAIGRVAAYPAIMASMSRATPPDASSPRAPTAGPDTQFTRAQLDPGLTPARVRRLRIALLDWYLDHAEPFPWREAHDPYAALVAAVCAQQTRMSRVLPLYERWMAAFPALSILASATPEAVLRVWGRGGYPRRALYLRATAIRCLREHGGVLPRDPEALLALPGVGPFTSAIVRCFGYGEDVPAIDTNVVRVLGRVVHGDLQPARETAAATIHRTAERLLPPGRSAEWNPALMDFGAQVCTARPRCERCPLTRQCAARPRFAAGETATPLRAQPAFEGSARQWRGRILGALRAAEDSVTTAALLDGLTSTPADRKRAELLLGALVAEGFAWSRDGRCGLAVL